MSDRGRHARESGAGFYRDILLLVAGILIVGALVFGGLSLLGGDRPDEPESAATTSSTTEAGADTTQQAPTSLGSTTTSADTTTSEIASSTTTTPPTTIREERAPAEVRVIVLNSIGVASLAGDLSDELAALGYQMTAADNYSPELSDTMIFHADGFSLEALSVSEAAEDGTVAPNAELAEAQGVDVVVVIGRSYQE